MDLDVFRRRSVECNGLDRRDVTVLIAEIERVQQENAALIRAKVVNIIPPAMPESELVGHLQKLSTEAHVEIVRSGRANAGLQQRLDAAEELLGRTEAALKVAQGNDRSEELIAEQEHNQHLYQALEAAKAESNAADEENAALHLKCIGYLGQIITANRKQEEAESALASANSRVEALTVEVERLGLLQESHVMEAKRIDEEWEKMSSRVERLRDALEGIRLEMDGGYGDTDYQSLWKACDRGVKALVDDAKEVKSVEP